MLLHLQCTSMQYTSTSKLCMVCLIGMRMNTRVLRLNSNDRSFFKVTAFIVLWSIVAVKSNHSMITLTLYISLFLIGYGRIWVVPELWLVSVRTAWCLDVNIKTYSISKKCPSLVCNTVNTAVNVSTPNIHYYALFFILWKLPVVGQRVHAFRSLFAE